MKIKRLSSLSTTQQLVDKDDGYTPTHADLLFDSIGDGAITTDSSGHIERINVAAISILGIPEKEALGKWFPEVFVAVNADGQPIPALERPITQAFVTGHTISERTYYRTKHNPRLPVFVTISPIISRGRPIGAIQVFRDTSHEYEVDRMKSEFISIASHQLRTPLSAISTYAQMLSAGYAGEMTKPQAEFVDTIVKSAKRMNQLIDALLDISKMESGHLKPNPTNIDCRELVKETINEFQTQAAAKKISLTAKLPNHSVPIVADGLLLHEVCSNFLSNAIKYTPENGRVRLGLTSTSSDITISVVDNGYGIPRASQKRTFSKFFRAGNVMRQETQGTGLGLYMIKLIADNIGGRVWFKSKEGKGSTFYFSIPKTPAGNL